MIRDRVRDKENLDSQVSPLLLKNKQDDQVSLLKRRRRVGLEVHVVNGIAVPTSEWRMVPPGVACPRGCEYRMDLATGKNMIRLLPSRTDRREGVDTNVVAVKSGASSDRSLSPCKKQARIIGTGNSLQLKQSPQATRIRPAPKSVEKEHKRTKTVLKKDGTRELARVAVKSREVVRPTECGKPGNRQKVTSRRDERVRKLGDGRTIITETITLQKVTVLAN
eukprot:CAMPEP_0169188632 /NCGR_PEP_ID=MMETSP1016-20121227/3560_1 /TAXON_ID=342587 /ORGANISM="Karlodinium micrum, Strain CCMP2283" /LENGTH=221 /DNA_ID=CAMNT_0009264669 /DNA_START=157 /DNA_END=822 /DNA_ORIENTATION=-